MRAHPGRKKEKTDKEGKDNTIKLMSDSDDEKETKR